MPQITDACHDSRCRYRRLAHGCVLLFRFLLLPMDFNDCWCISFTLSTAAAAAVANPIIRNGMDPLHAVPVIANYLLRSLNLHRVVAVDYCCSCWQRRRNIADQAGQLEAHQSRSQNPCRRIT